MCEMAAKAKGLALGPDADIYQILSTLEQGTIMMRFYRRKGSRPEKHLYCLKADTMEILQFVMAAGRSSTSPRNADESSECNKKNTVLAIIYFVVLAIVVVLRILTE